MHSQIALGRRIVVSPQVITSAEHCSREISGYHTNSFTSARRLMRDGSELQAASIVLRHPEIAIMDISNPENFVAHLSPQQIIAVFREVQSAAKRLAEASADVRLVRGEDLLPELCATAPSKSILVSFKNEVLSAVLGSDYAAQGHAARLHVSKTLPVRNLSARSLQMLQHFSAYYSGSIEFGMWSNCRTLHIDHCYDAHPIWSGINSLGAVKALILGGGLPVAVSMMHFEQTEHFVFSEYHRQNDANDIIRGGLGEISYDIGEPESASVGGVVLIDKVYSGGSLMLAKEKLHARFPSAVIKTVGLFPKSLKGVLSCDYIVFAGALLETARIRSFLSPATWHFDLLALARAHS